MRHQHFHKVGLIYSAGAALALSVGIASAGAGNTTSPTDLIPISALQSAVAEHGRAIQSFSIQGVVCAVVSQRNIVVLQDSSATALFQLPSISPAVATGDRVVITGKHCSLTRTPYGIQVCVAPVVDNNGSHYALVKSGDVYLKAGMNPIRVSWFNGIADFALDLEYEGPGIAKQNVPAGVLWHAPPGKALPARPSPGVRYAAYEGDDWYALPDFSRLRPVAEGVATNFSVIYRPRDQNCGLNFNGFIQVPRSGLYTFYLTSDDGSQLYAGVPDVLCKTVSSGGKCIPTKVDFESNPVIPRAGQWITLAGEVTFVGQSDIGAELDIISGAKSVQAVVVCPSPASDANLLHQRVQVTGICQPLRDPQWPQAVRLVIPGPDQIKIQKEPDEIRPASISSNTVLVTARQVRRMKPQQAAEKIPVRLKGVIIQASPVSLVLQDDTGGVFVHYSSSAWTDEPRVGDLWEIEGTTGPGDFSPVIYATTAKFLGNGVLPQPVRPTWDQLMNGSLDAQYVEIHGVVVSESDTGMVLLTPDGKIHVTVDEMRLFYVGGHDAFVLIRGNRAPDEVARSYVGSVVRIRGCVAAVWNRTTRQVVSGQIRMSAAVVSVDQPRPRDPFALPTSAAADLFLFDPRASVFQRTKVTGQIIYSRPNEYYLLDALTGLRIQTEQSLPLRPGDLVEAEGFPQLGRASPVLLDARIRKTGRAPLPAPVRVAATNLLDDKLDATFVRLEAVLVNNSVDQEGRVLELQAGSHHFLARLAPEYSRWGTFSPGCRLQLTGVYASANEDRANLSADAFELLLNRPEDIVVLQQPPWWTLRRVVTLAAGLAGALGVAFVWITMLRQKIEQRTVQLKTEIEARQRVEQHRAMEQERIRVARDLHDELGAGLTEMSILGTLAKNPAVAAREREGYLDRLTQSARQLITGLDEIVWAINPQYDSVASLATYFSLFAQRFLNLAGIACRLQVAEIPNKHPLDSKKRHGIFLAFKEALNNIVRHSEATEVELRIEVTGNQLLITVQDNGCGLRFPRESTGNGLIGMDKRLQQLGGHCQVRSEPGCGTRVEFHLDLNGAPP